MNDNAFRRNFIQNPLLIEATRFRRRFFGESRRGGTYRVYLALAGAIYLLLVMVAVASRSGLSTGAVLEFQNFIFCLVVPAVTYSAVAGEREKRTWELLRVAPVTKAQIIVGKFLSAAMVIAVVALFVLPLATICYNRDSDVPVGAFFALIQSLAFGLALAAVCIFISARTNRTLTAQVLIYTFIFIWLVVLPMFFATFSTGDSRGGSTFWLHPFLAVWFMATGKPPTPDSAVFYGPIVQGIFYLSVIVCALEAAIYSIGTSGEDSGRFSNA